MADGKIKGIYVELRADPRQLKADLDSAKGMVKAAADNMSDAMGGAMSSDSLRRNLSALVTDLSQLQRSSKVGADAFKNIGFAAADLGARLGLPEKQFAALQARMLQNQAAEAQVNALRRIGAQAGLTAAEIRKLGQDMNVSEAVLNKMNATGGQGGILGMLGGQGALGKVGTALGAGYVVKQAFDIAAAPVVSVAKAGMEFERLNMSLAAISGSKAGGAEVLSFIREESDKAGVSLLDTAAAFKSLLAAGKASGMDDSTVRDIFTSVVEAGAVVGMTQEQQSRSLLALEQMISKGKVSTEELRKQLGNSLPGAFSTAARAMGVTTAKLSDMLQKGEVISKDFLPKFAKALREDYGGSLEDAAKTGTAALNRLESSWEQFKASFYDSGIVVATLDAVRANLEAMQGYDVDFNPRKASNPATTPQGELEQIADIRAQRDALQERYEALRHLGDASPKVSALKNQLAALNREMLNAQVATGKGAEDKMRQKDVDQSTPEALEKQFKFQVDQDREANEALAKRKALLTDLAILRETGGTGDVSAIARMQEEKAHTQAMLTLERELIKARLDGTVDTASVRSSMSLERQRHAVAMENIAKEQKQREDSMLSKLAAEKESRDLAYKQSLLDAENARKLAAQTEARTIGRKDIEDRKGEVTALYKDILDNADAYGVDRLAVEKQLNDKLIELDVERLRSSKESSDGMTAALKNYAREAGNDGANMFELWSSGLKSAEDAIVEFGTKGAVSIEQLGQAFQAEFVRTQVARPLVSSIAKFDFSSIFSKIFHEGGIVGETATTGRMVSPLTFVGARRYHNGLMPDEFPAILQRGEAVIPRNQVGGMSTGRAQVNSVTIHQSFDFRGADSGAETRLRAASRIIKEQAVAEALAQVESGANRGGKFAKTVGRRA